MTLAELGGPEDSPLLSLHKARQGQQAADALCVQAAGLILIPGSLVWALRRLGNRVSSIKGKWPSKRVRTFRSIRACRRPSTACKIIGGVLGVSTLGNLRLGLSYKSLAPLTPHRVRFLHRWRKLRSRSLQLLQTAVNSLKSCVPQILGAPPRLQSCRHLPCPASWKLQGKRLNRMESAVCPY